MNKTEIETMCNDEECEACGEEGMESVAPLQLADPDLVSYYILESERKLFLDKKIDISVMQMVRMILRYNMEDHDIPVEKRQPIMIYIMSPGGDSDCMWSLIDVIMASKTPVWTVNIGCCYSAASEIFLAGSKRLMFKHSKFMYHDGYAALKDNTRRLKSQLDTIMAELDISNRYLLARTTIPAEELVKHLDEDWTMDAEYCLKNGVCHHIVESIEDVI